MYNLKKTQLYEKSCSKEKLYDTTSMSEEADKRGVNYSRLLQEALLAFLGGTQGVKNPKLLGQPWGCLFFTHFSILSPFSIISSVYRASSSGVCGVSFLLQFSMIPIQPERTYAE